MIIDVLLDAFWDTFRLLPFLLVAYGLMEFIEHAAEPASRKMLRKTGKLGPLVGGVVGVVPQCGFSAAASGFYAGGVISVGTLLAVFLSTSDEMLPILIAAAVPVDTIFQILAMKIGIGIVSGFVVDLFWKTKKKEIHGLCEQEHCHCGEDGILKPAVLHTAKTLLFIFLVSLVIGFLVELVGEKQIAYFISNRPVSGVFLSALVGLIPNCAASVIITELYVQGILGMGQMLAGLLAGAGVGLLVLFRNNKKVTENLKILGVLYGVSVLWGIVIMLIGIK